jgi:serpin B
MDRRTFLALLATPAVLALLEACSDDLSAPGSASVRADVARVAADESQAMPAARSLSVFGTDVFRRVAAAQPGANVVLSPASIAIALTMVSAGAAGATLTEMLDVLDVDDAAGRHRSMNALTAELDRRNHGDTEAGVQLSILDQLWGQRGFTFVEEFLDLLAAEYGAGLETADFEGDPDGARQRINEWVDEATAGRIPELLAEGTIDAATRLALVNAIHLKASWADPFDPTLTLDAPFTRVDGSTVDVPMMRGTGQLMYATGDGWQAVELAYDGGELAMLIFLPEPGFLDQFEQIFLVTDATTYLAATEVFLQLPTWDTGSTFELADVLAGMGMPTAFSTDADFTGISTDEPLHIGAVIHQANITVDEAGTEAAAATAVVVEAGSAAPSGDGPVEMIVDRPFVYALRDRATGAVLFLGRVADPSAVRAG